MDDWMQEAKNEVIQDLWDAHVIAMWREKPHWTMKWVMANFLSANGPVRFNGMKRVPRECKKTNGCTITRFIAAYFPKTNDVLWSGGSADLALKRFRSEEELEDMADATKVRKESYDRNKASRESGAEAKSHKLVADQRARSGRGNWDACK